MIRTTSGVGRTLALGTAVLVVLLGGSGCSKSSKKTSKGKTGLRAEAMKPAVKKGKSTPNRIVLKRVDDKNKPPVATMGPAQKALLKTVSKGILAGRNTPPPTVSSATIKPTLNAVFGLDVARARKTFLWKSSLANPTFQKIFKGKPYQMITRAIGLDPTQVTDQLVVAFGSRTWNFGMPEHAVVLFTGRFDTAKVMAALKALPAGQLGNTKPMTVAGKSALAVSAPGFLPFVLIAVKKNVFAFCSVALAPNVAKQLPGFGDPAMAARIKNVNRKALVWGTFGHLGSLFGAMRMSAALGAIGHIEGGTFSVVPQKVGWRASMSIVTASDQAAGGLMTLISMGQAAFAAGGGSGSPSLMVRLIKKIQVSQKNKSVVAAVTLSNADAKALSATILRMMR